MAGLDLSGSVGTRTKKGTKITQAMADAVTADNEYIKVVQNNSHLVAELIPRAIGRALEKIGLLAEGHVIGWMTEHYVVDTGRLRNSITHAIMNDETVAVGTNVRYAEYVHFGHRTIDGKTVAGRPFLTAPIQKHLDEYRDILKAELSGGSSA